MGGMKRDAAISRHGALELNQPKEDVVIEELQR